MSKEYYDTTDYVKPGRSGLRLDFGCNLHAFCVFAQDENGKVACTEPVLKFVRPDVQSKPYLGKAHEIPGKFPVSHYDEGGQNVAYYDTTVENLADKSGKFRPGESVDATENVIGGLVGWEWLNYTVDVKQAGAYTATLDYGTPLPGKKDFVLLVDGTPAGRFPVTPHAASHFGVDSKSTIASLMLPEGRHIITLLPLSGGINFSHLEFKLNK